MAFRVITLLRRTISLTPRSFRIREFHSMVIDAHFSANGRVFTLSFNYRRRSEHLHRLKVILSLATNLMTIFRQRRSVAGSRIQLFFRDSICPVLTVTNFRCLMFLVGSVLRRPACLITIISRGRFLSNFLLLQGRVSRFNSLFFLTNVRFSRIKFKFRGLSAAIRRVLLTGQSRSCMKDTILIQLTSMRATCHVDRIRSLLRTTTYAFIFVRPLIYRGRYTMNFSIFVCGECVRYRFPVGGHVFRNVQRWRARDRLRLTTIRPSPGNKHLHISARVSIIRNCPVSGSVTSLTNGLSRVMANSTRVVNSVIQAIHASRLIHRILRNGYVAVDKGRLNERVFLQVIILRRRNGEARRWKGQNTRFISHLSGRIIISTFDIFRTFFHFNGLINDLALSRIIFLGLNCSRLLRLFLIVIWYESRRLRFIVLPSRVAVNFHRVIVLLPWGPMSFFLLLSLPFRQLVPKVGFFVTNVRFFISKTSFFVRAFGYNIFLSSPVQTVVRVKVWFSRVGGRKSGWGR